MNQTVTTSEVEVVGLSPQSVLTVQRESSPQDLGSHLADVLPRVYQYILAQGQQPSGRPFMRYLEMTDKFLIDAGMAVIKPLDGQDDIKPGELPGGVALTTLFTGEVHLVGIAWEAIFAFAREEGLEKRAAGWDEYVNDPASVSPKQVQTRLYLPV